jgi:AmmeMemoRadiSam system protein A
VAARAVSGGCAGIPAPPSAIDPGQFPPPLRQPRGTFVTIRRQGLLRGCRGSIAAKEPLVVNVARSARSAAFSDERFPPVTAVELFELAIHISILNEPESLPVADEAELLASLRPGHDGLILTAGTHQGLFLPAVWDKLPEPRDFLEHLKQKAGLDTDFWSGDVQVQRFTVEECHGDVAALLGGENTADAVPGDA